jgi:hypothetical protein
MHNTTKMCEGMEVCIFNFSTKWRWVISFKLHPLYPFGKCPRVGLNVTKKEKSVVQHVGSY